MSSSATLSRPKTSRSKSRRKPSRTKDERPRLAKAPPGLVFSRKHYASLDPSREIEIRILPYPARYKR